MCSHPCTGDATDEKIAEKNREKFNELIFWRQNHGLRQRVATHAIFTARWRRDNLKKIASPSQAKNRSCSRGFTLLYVNYYKDTGLIYDATSALAGNRASKHEVEGVLNRAKFGRIS